jgi:hypothetical protein
VLEFSPITRNNKLYLHPWMERKKHMNIWTKVKQHLWLGLILLARDRLRVRRAGGPTIMYLAQILLNTKFKKEI